MSRCICLPTSTRYDAKCPVHTVKRLRKPPLQPQCGTYTHHLTARRVVGVMLMKNAPTARYNWWVGGEQVALITWKDGRETAQTKLYSYVRRTLMLHGPNALAALEKDAFVQVVWKN